MEEPYGDLGIYFACFKCLLIISINYYINNNKGKHQRLRYWWCYGVLSTIGWGRVAVNKDDRL